MTLLLLTLFGCGGSDGESGDDAVSCGDIDGPGTDSGDLPDVLANWSVTYASDYYDSICSAPSLDRDSEGWLNSFYILGRAPDALYVYFGTQGAEESERFIGAMDPYGGITITGRYAHTAGTLHAQFGGLLYHDPNLDRDVIQGASTFGLDADGDDGIDCLIRASWTAYKAG